MNTAPFRELLTLEQKKLEDELETVAGATLLIQATGSPYQM